MIYLDSSAVVKLVHVEPQTPALRAWLTASGQPALVSSLLAHVEGARALRRTDAAALVNLPLVLGMSVLSWARVSIRYLCIAAWLLPILCCELLAAVRRPRLRRALAALMIAGALVAGVGHAGGKTREDVRGAVREARLAGAELLQADTSLPPIYTALLSQPPRRLLVLGCAGR